MPLWCNAWECRELKSQRCFFPPALAQLSWWVKPPWLQQICGIKWRSHSADKETVPIPEKLISCLVLTRSHNQTCKICLVNKDVFLWLNTRLCWSANPKGNAHQTLLLYRCVAWLCVSSHTCQWGNTCPNIETSLFCSLWTQKQAAQTGVFQVRLVKMNTLIPLALISVCLWVSILPRLCVPGHNLQHWCANLES